MPASLLTARALRLAAKLRLAASSVASVYASALSYTRSCVFSNANAYCFSQSDSAIYSKGDR
jgi:hypothetical protein